MTDVKRPYRGVSAEVRRDARRRLLLDACLELIGSGGTAAVTAESVSAQAKLTKRYFYESFTGRDALLVAVLDEMFVELIAAIRHAIASSDSRGRAEMITEVFVSMMCADPRRARLYAESRAIPALQARREEAILAFAELIANEGPDGGSVDTPRHLMTRIIVSGVTDVVTSWIDGTLTTDRTTLTDAMTTLGRAIESSPSKPTSQTRTAP